MLWRTSAASEPWQAGPGRRLFCIGEMDEWGPFGAQEKKRKHICRVRVRLVAGCRLLVSDPHGGSVPDERAGVAAS